MLGRIAAAPHLRDGVSEPSASSGQAPGTEQQIYSHDSESDDMEVSRIQLGDQKLGRGIGCRRGRFEIFFPCFLPFLSFEKKCLY